jgi:predicted enzyme related to lactoylglutathione lyase
MNEHEKINYVEFPAKDIEKAKAFFHSIFGWSFADFGPEYVAFSDAGINGGFFKSDRVACAEEGSALLFFTAMICRRRKPKLKKPVVQSLNLSFRFPAVAASIFAILTGMNTQFGQILESLINSCMECMVERNHSDQGANRG